MAENILSGKVGGVDKKIVIPAVGAGAVIIGIVWYRSKKAQSSSSTAGMVTDPAGNMCSVLDPNSGYCPGTPEDLAYQQSSGTSLVGSNNGSYVGGQIIGYDQYGNPVYSSGPTAPGPGSFTSNAQWAQAAQTYITQQEPNADPATIATALGLYIEGKPVTADQAQIVDQAIAFEGQPPVAGPNGDPPGVITNTTGGTTTQVSVPNVIGDNFGKAYNTITAAGLVSSPGHNGMVATYIITSQSPAANTKVNKGSTVTITAQVKVPNVVGQEFGPAYNTLTRAGFKVSPGKGGVNAKFHVTAQSPKEGVMANHGTTVTLTIRKS